MTQTRLCQICQRAARVHSFETRLGARVDCTTCGKYTVFPQELTIQSDVRHILSAIVRRASETGNPIEVTEDNVGTLLQSAFVPTNPLEQMNLALIYVSQAQTRADQFVDVKSEQNYPVAFARDSEEFLYLLETLVRRGLLEEPKAMTFGMRPQYRLTPEGWSTVGRLRESQRDSNQAFVAMWFTDKLKGAWEEGFKPALESNRFIPIRVDLVEHNDKIDDVIVAEIRRSGLMVADFTGNRGGVYFEAGFAMGLGIPVIWTCKEPDINDVHFDTRQYNHIVWNDPRDLKHKLEYRIAATMPGRVIPRQK